MWIEILFELPYIVQVHRESFIWIYIVDGRPHHAIANNDYLFSMELWWSTFVWNRRGELNHVARNRVVHIHMAKSKNTHGTYWMGFAFSSTKFQESNIIGGPNLDDNF